MDEPKTYLVSTATTRLLSRSLWTVALNDASVLRLVGAVLMEISENWETNRKYLTMGLG